MSGFEKTTGALACLLAASLLIPVGRARAVPASSTVHGRTASEAGERHASVAEVTTTLSRAFSGMPLDFLEARAVTAKDGGPSCRFDATNARLTVDCEIFVNRRSYSTWAEQARHHLASIADTICETNVFGAFVDPESIVRAARERGAAFGEIGIFILEPGEELTGKLSDQEVPWRISWFGFQEDKRGTLNRFGVKTVFGVEFDFFSSSGEKIWNDFYGTWHGTFLKTGPNDRDKPVGIVYPGFPFKDGARAVHRVPLTFEGLRRGVVEQIARIDAKAVLAW